MKSKEELRNFYKSKRHELCEKGLISEISDSIVKKIQNSTFYKNSKHIMLFYPKKGEINLLNLMKDKSRQFYLPRCIGNNLCVCPYCADDKLKLGSFKVYEPINEAIADKNILDIIFIPALAADKNLRRLGYGGGFYDRFLSDIGTKTLKITVICKDFILDELPYEPFDVCCDITLTN